MPTNDLQPRVLSWCLALLVTLALGATTSHAQTLAARAKEARCIDAPQMLTGTNVYKCNTASGVPAMFNVPEGTERPPVRRSNGNSSSVGIAAAAPLPSPVVTQPTPGLPRVDAATQKGRDDLRRRVLQDELATEEKLLGESRSAYANGAPAALPEENAQPQRYAERIARLREAVLRHERNIEMLRRELAALR
ncbi:MAG TPA: hypothetical protein VNG69_16710 [Casimicrobiaceae bacterium]|nr:hypothetical protein [Casimicrobiaceae bacterium]